MSDERPSIDLSHLTQAQKLELVHQLWDEIAANPADIPLPPGTIEEMERRAGEYKANPGAAVPWEVLRERLSGER
jgi:putative addiction module component (TIGR02574 family)